MSTVYIIINVIIQLCDNKTLWDLLCWNGLFNKIRNFKLQLVMLNCERRKKVSNGENSVTSFMQYAFWNSFFDIIPNKLSYDNIKIKGRFTDISLRLTKYGLFQQFTIFYSENNMRSLHNHNKKVNNWLKRLKIAILYRYH